VSTSLSRLNALPDDQASETLRSCCGASRWVDAMVARRPYGSLEQLLSTADEIWRSLSPTDWLEAFGHHPRIGEQRTAVQATEQAVAWSAGEQSRFVTAAPGARDALATINREYEARFGFIYIVCAEGRSADELLSIAQARLDNEPGVELRVAAEEQRLITTLRLRKLITELE
jgi:OHCU decarboxylase